MKGKGPGPICEGEGSQIRAPAPFYHVWVEGICICHDDPATFQDVGRAATCSVTMKKATAFLSVLLGFRQPGRHQQSEPLNAISILGQHRKVSGKDNLNKMLSARVA